MKRPPGKWMWWDLAEGQRSSLFVVDRNVTNRRDGCDKRREGVEDAVECSLSSNVKDVV